MAEQTPFAMSDPVLTTARALRSPLGLFQEGAFDPTSMKVSVGSGRSVDVAEGTCIVTGDNADQGNYRIRNDFVKNSEQFFAGGIEPQEANPRLDLIVARLYDTEYDSSGERVWRLEVVKGTATSGATLDNRNGATDLPDSAMLLADVLVATSGTITLRDRRKWARGAYAVKRDTGANFTRTAAAANAATEINDAALSMRVECSGRPLRMRLHILIFSSLAVQIILKPWLDGALAPEAPTAAGGVGANNLAANQFSFSHIEHLILTPTPGSHVFTWRFGANNTTANAISFARADYPIWAEVEELDRPMALNE